MVMERDAVGFGLCHGPSGPISCIGFLWPPASLFIDDRRSDLVQNRIHDAPLGVDNVLATEKIPDAMHRVAEADVDRAA